MKTTIEIPDDLAKEASSTAQLHNTSLRELVVSGPGAALSPEAVPERSYGLPE